MLDARIYAMSYVLYDIALERPYRSGAGAQGRVLARAHAEHHEVVKASIEAMFERVSRQRPLDLLADFVGCASGDSDLSQNYKAELTQSLARKASIRLRQDASTSPPGLETALVWKIDFADEGSATAAELAAGLVPSGDARRIGSSLVLGETTLGRVGEWAFAP